MILRNPRYGTESRRTRHAGSDLYSIRILDRCARALTLSAGDSKFEIMSAEPARKRAYSSDLRWRVVYQRIGMNLSYTKIAKNLNIARSTAQRTYKWFEITGNVDPVLRKSRPYLRALDEHTELMVIGLILQSPSLYLEEICSRVHELTAVAVSPPCICRLFKRYGLTRKKLRRVALQRCDALRGAFMAQCMMFSRHQFVWIDETGSDARDHMRRFGYAFRGLRPVSRRLLTRGQRINAIAGLSSSGIVAVETVQGSVTGEKFYDFLRGSLIPQMLPYNGSNPCSIIIMDNCSIHHTSVVKDLLRQAGLVALYLPPYSPDLNPIEEAFSYVKAYLKKHDDMIQAGVPLLSIIKSAFESISADNCNAWISDSGYPIA